ncbi:flagellar basal body protein [Aestuariivirga sp.]|jgi:flagellar basal-body rod protein FlgB|uniref:flagellar basal body protein n=1 Tax=Aestuariivirga sp. TaxID=2650926 RepID=UPI0037842BBC
MTWLSERQALTAANIANADTPGYRAQSISPFEASLQDKGLQLTATSIRHMALGPADTEAASPTSGTSWASSLSGNNVSLEVELMAASSANRMMSVDAGVLRTFHRMYLSAVKV